MSKKLSEKLSTSRLLGYPSLADEARSLEHTVEELKADLRTVRDLYTALEAELEDLRANATWVREQRIKVRDRELAMEAENAELRATVARFQDLLRKDEDFYTYTELLDALRGRK